MDQSRIRNFCIIAHIDHGKSTLADRMLELTGTVEKRAMQAQLLDSMDLEREKGITIKLQPVKMAWRDHSLNLIDTPGHVDFSYEVSRSLAACEGAVLVVDASQGIQAQTLANVYLAIDAGLEIIPVLNKIDLPAADPERVAGEVANLLGCDPASILRVSGKTGQGVEDVLDAIVADIPHPRGDASAPLRALIFDSVYDEYRGVILYVRVVDGVLAKNAPIQMMATSADGLALETGTFAPVKTPTTELRAGQIGYIVTNLRSTSEAWVGDTVTTFVKSGRPDSLVALPGYKQAMPFVFAGFFPTSNEQYPELKDALDKLSLNDAALVYEPESSQVLGFGYRVGFLGLLHLDIVHERLEREYDLELVVTNPSTNYQLRTIGGEETYVRNAADLPDPSRIEAIREPWITGEVVVPKDYVGGVIQLIIRIRGIQKNLTFMDETLALVAFEAPLANVLTDFYDELKSITSGYGSFNYDLADFRQENLVRLDILVGGDMVDSLSMITHRDEAYRRGKDIVEKLKDVIPRQSFEVSIQAAIGGKIVAREDVRALRKDVTAKLYGGDVSRKNKLLDKQKKGKARMKRFGKVDIPAEAFMVLVRKDS